jgi:adenylate cyclase
VPFGLVAALCCWLVSATAFGRGLENWLLDNCFFQRGDRRTGAPVVIIGLDEGSLAALGKPAAYISPELAEVVRYVHEQGAAAVGIDLMVPASLGHLAEIQRPGGLGEARPMGAAVFGSRAVLPIDWNPQAQEAARPLKEWWQIKASLKPEPADFGFVNLTEDEDQFLRRQQLLVGEGEDRLPSFALALYARFRGADFDWGPEHRSVRVGEETIPLDRDRKLLINFIGAPETIRPLSFQQVLLAARQNLPSSDFAGKIVIVGVTARSGQDYHATPYANSYARLFSPVQAGLMSGPEVHAQVLATLYDRSFLVTPVWLHPLGWLLVFGVLLGKAFAGLNLEWGLAVALVHHFAWKALAFAAFASFGWRVPILPMLLLGALTYAGTFIWRWRQMRRMLGVVKSEAVTRALEADPRRLDPGGESRVITVLFADIRDFTAFSERDGRHPQEVVALLNAYFSVVVPLIERRGGTIDKFMGDGIMAIFGAPSSSDTHALQAVLAAQAVVACVHSADAQRRWAKLQFPGMRIGVGIHTGLAVVGAVGSRSRLDYTAIGDTINTAARIEGKTRDLGAPILISSSTFEAFPAAHPLRQQCTPYPEPVPVKGKKQGLHLYRVELAPAERSPVS